MDDFYVLQIYDGVRKKLLYIKFPKLRIFMIFHYNLLFFLNLIFAQTINFSHIFQYKQKHDERNNNQNSQSSKFSSKIPRSISSLDSSKIESFLF